LLRKTLWPELAKSERTARSGQSQTGIDRAALPNIRTSHLEPGTATKIDIGNSFVLGRNAAAPPLRYRSVNSPCLPRQWRGFSIQRDGESSAVDDSYRRGVPPLIKPPSRQSQI
jgi:hypothetical protein